jgi:hypothetical protein
VQVKTAAGAAGIYLHLQYQETAMTTIENLNVTKGALATRLFRTLTVATLLAAVAGVGEAHEVHVDARNIFNGKELYVAEINPIASTGCGEQTVGAPTEFTITSGPNAGTYEFLFWNINAKPYADSSVTFQPMCGDYNSAVALYIQLSGCSPTESCPPPTTDTTYAYSLNENTIIAGETPIKSATSGWTPGSTVVTTPSTIEAEPELPPYGKFKGWDILLGAFSTSSSLTLTVPGNYVFALYGIPDPDPCQGIKNEVAAFTCDGLSPSACVAERKYLSGLLNSCETTYGEEAPAK